jgi:cytochrome c
MIRPFFALILSVTAAQTAHAAGDPAAGARAFAQCRACHSVGAGERSVMGPNLWGVVGARAGAKPGYAYSPAMAKSGIVWTGASLDAFMLRPRAVVPGTKMIFGGIPAKKTRDDLVAYLATLKPARR